MSQLNNPRVGNIVDLENGQKARILAIAPGGVLFVRDTETGETMALDDLNDPGEIVEVDRELVP